MLSVVRKTGVKRHHRVLMPDVDRVVHSPIHLAHLRRRTNVRICINVNISSLSACTLISERMQRRCCYFKKISTVLEYMFSSTNSFGSIQETGPRLHKTNAVIYRPTLRAG